MQYAERSKTLRFNGAATFRSRKAGLTDHVAVHVVRASMGPRPFGRGRPPQKAQVDEYVIRLQWGRDLSVAEGVW